MLVITRKVGSSFFIEKNIKITLVKVESMSRVKIGITAPIDIRS